MMKLHDYSRGIVVTDNGRIVAKAHKTGRGPWILRAYAACWTDPRARTQGLVPGKYPELMHVRTRPEALNHMRALAETGRNTGNRK